MPISSPFPSAVIRRDEFRRRAPVAPEGAVPGAGDRVLAVVSETSLGFFVRESLRAQCGAAVEIVSNGVAAFEKLAAVRYALVVSDVRLPLLSGIELFFWLREAQPAASRRFVLVTAPGDERQFGDQLAQWGVPTLAHPFTTAQLLAACGSYLRRPAILSA